MVKNCSCDYYRYPLPAGAEYCTYARHPAWGHCFYSLYQELETHSLSWFSLCLKPCNESFYKLSMGTSRWPSSKSADWILTVLGGPQNRSQSPRSNIAKVNIYQRHSYLKMKETPPVKKLFSDMKDLMSLLFGMSVLSLVELLELLLDAVALALLLGYHRLCEAWASQTGPSTAAGASHTQLEAGQMPVSCQHKAKHLGGQGSLISHGRFQGPQWESQLKSQIGHGAHRHPPQTPST